MADTNNEPKIESVRRMLNPKSIAIVGFSARPGSPGQSAIKNLATNDYKADVYLVGRSGGEVDGRKVHTSIDELPEGIDLGIFTLPAAGVPEAIEGAIKKKMGGAVCFASGFAETGAEGRALEQKIIGMLRASNFALLGPNCLGFTNLLNGLSIGLFAAPKTARTEPKPRSAIAVLGQSGGLVGHIRQTLTARGIPAAYNVTTGNEAGLDLCDFIGYFMDDETVGTAVIYTEHIKRPAAFLKVAQKARDLGKTIVMMHPGKSAKGAAAFQSHTGALAGDYALMRTIVEAAGVVTVESLEEWADVSEIMVHYPKLPSKGTGLITFSGALCGIAHDLSEGMGIDYPEPTADSIKKLEERLPDFVDAKNPADLTTAPAFETDLLGHATKVFLDDPNYGAVAIAAPLGNMADKYLDGMVERIGGNEKPLCMTPLGDGRPMEPAIVKRIYDANIVLFYSAERMLRAVARITQHGRTAALAGKRDVAKPFDKLPDLGTGAMAEWAGKKVLQAIGVATPAGQLCKTKDEALEVAGKIGFPVVVKAQSQKLTHKTEAGGVIVGVKDKDALAKAWDDMHKNIAAHAPGLVLDGLLIEAMAGKGVELMIGGRRDPQWGAVLLIGLGGIWVEALGDVRLLPADASEDWIRAEIMKLKTSKLLTGFRGAPAVDIDAVVKTARALGRLMQTNAQITEIDINPLVVHPKGQGATALDALIVTKS
jgi:acyl-CoA synthetase (NDP forming)